MIATNPPVPPADPSGRRKKAQEAESAPSGTFGLLVMVAIILWHAVVVEALWNWNVKPLGFPGLNLWHAAGVVLLVRLLTLDYTLTRGSGSRFAGAVLGSSLIVPAFALAIGYVYHVL